MIYGAHGVMMRRAHTRIPIPSMFPRDVPERASEASSSSRAVIAPAHRSAAFGRPYGITINWNFSGQLMHICEVKELY